MKISNIKRQRIASVIALAILTSIFIYAPKGALAAVQFGTFTVTQGNNTVMCYWQTLSQTNNASFTVEKAWAPTGRSANMSWISLTSIQGAGDSHNTMTYNFTDNNPGYVGNQQVTDGYILYRIKATDFHGYSMATTVKTVRWPNVSETSNEVVVADGGNDTRSAYINRFVAKAKNSDVYCTWQSMPGADNSVYTVEKSTNGITFTAFATVVGDGVTTSIQKYMVVDYNVTSSTVWYRLAQFDAGLGTTYSPIKKIILSGGAGGRPENIATLTSFSSEDGLHLNYISSSAGTAHLYVMDCVGKTVAKKDLQAVEGENAYTVNDVNLSQGIYYVTIVKDADACTQKILKN